MPFLTFSFHTQKWSVQITNYFMVLIISFFQGSLLNCVWIHHFDFRLFKECYSLKRIEDAGSSPWPCSEWREAGWGSTDYTLHVACRNSGWAEAGLKSVLCLYGRGSVSKWTAFVWQKLMGLSQTVRASLNCGSGRESLVKVLALQMWRHEIGSSADV